MEKAHKYHGICVNKGEGSCKWECLGRGVVTLERAKLLGWVSVLFWTVCGLAGKVPWTVGQKASQGQSPGDQRSKR